MNVPASLHVPSFPAPRTDSSTRVRDAIDANYDALWRFLRRLGVDEHEVEDAAQHVLLVFAQRATTVAPGAERSFILGSAVRNSR